MGFYDVYRKYKDIPEQELFGGISPEDVEMAIRGERHNDRRLLTLLSPVAEKYLEAMARKAHELTVHQFGRTVQLYTPMYLSNYCENRCAYCGFNSHNRIARKKLMPEEVEREASFIAAAGLQHILILTGESRQQSSPGYIRECLAVLKNHFSSICVEIYALTGNEYAELARDGVDGMTMYQETYDEKTYDTVHIAGPKKNYLFRLDAPERAAVNGMRNVNIGALLGLSAWRKEAFFVGLHARYLQDVFPDVEIGASVPRLRPHAGAFSVTETVTDRNIVQMITALRIFLPRLGIAVSTRESPALRENLLPLGITRLSAGSSTRVGGHTLESGGESDRGQFEISDARNVEEIKTMVSARGYQPVLKDWVRI